MIITINPFAELAAAEAATAQQLQSAEQHLAYCRGLSEGLAQARRILEAAAQRHVPETPPDATPPPTVPGSAAAEPEPEPDAPAE